MSDVIYYIAMSLFILGAIAYGVYMNYTIKNKLRLNLHGLLTKNTLVLGGAGAICILGLILFTVSFYQDPATINYLTSKGIVVEAGHQFLSYFFLILFGIMCVTFLTAFFYYFYLDNLDAKYRKWFKITMYSSIPFILIFFFAMSEGNAPYLQYPLCNSIYIGKHGIKFINNAIKPAPYYNGTQLDFGISIAFYAIFILSGALFVLGLCDHYVYKNFGKHGLLSTCFLIAFPMGIVGARLWYVLLDISKLGNASSFIQDPMNILRLNDGGLGIMGGAILGIISGVTYMLIIKYWKKDQNYYRMSYLKLVDIIVPTILIAQAIGRFGNFFNCEVHGNEIPVASLSWMPTFMRLNYQFDYGTKLSDPNLAYLPLSTIETFTNLIGYFVIYFGICRGFKKYHADGSGVGYYFIWYGLTRALLEPLRAGAYEYQMSVISSYCMVGGGILIVLFFAAWKILREKKLWMYKTRVVEEVCLVNNEITKKELIRNSIILASAILVIIIVGVICFNIW